MLFALIPRVPAVTLTAVLRTQLVTHCRKISRRSMTEVILVVLQLMSRFLRRHARASM